ncbi:LysR family transcriptional regulator [Hydrogenophaga sp.]|uniref:LysR family transcriptional regulator n=1 Tax=Hydrogenophaga sp. TaxID=1904254 RepID=UPI0025C2C73C|nr:LysR family transcriptional regulator [Hydrogenophaga sp.]
MDFDLNLLRVLVNLDDTRNVTRAAQQLGMSQSGFSTALNRLRLQFEDTLFVRTSKGMEPTPRAREMVGTARAVLGQVRTGILADPQFDPATTQTEFRLVMADVAEIVFLPRLIRHLAVHAPHASVRCFPLPTSQLEAAMEAGEADLAMGYFPDLNKQVFFHQRLYMHTFACVMRADHPHAQTHLSLKDFESLDHALVSSPARSTDLVDRFIERKGIHRHVVLRTPHYMSLAAVIAESELVATVPLAAGMSVARSGAIRLVRPPFDPPRFAVQQHWHRLYRHDTRNQWLRAQVSQLFNEQSDEWRAVEQSMYGGETIRRRAAPSRISSPGGQRPAQRRSVGANKV